jgi:hypothetical protein
MILVANFLYFVNLLNHNDPTFSIKIYFDKSRFKIKEITIEECGEYYMNGYISNTFIFYHVPICSLLILINYCIFFIILKRSMLIF